MCYSIICLELPNSKKALRNNCQTSGWILSLTQHIADGWDFVRQDAMCSQSSVSATREGLRVGCIGLHRRVFLIKPLRNTCSILGKFLVRKWTEELHQFHSCKNRDVSQMGSMPHPIPRGNASSGPSSLAHPGGIKLPYAPLPLPSWANQTSVSLLEIESTWLLGFIQAPSHLF